MCVFLHAIPFFTSGVLPEAQYVEKKWVWSGLVKLSGFWWAAVCGPNFALGWSQALWISPRWDLRAQLSIYMRLHLKWSRTISGNLNQSPQSPAIWILNRTYFDSWACRSHCGDIHNAWDHPKAKLGPQTAAHHKPDILTNPDQTHLHSTYWASGSTPLVKNGIACKNTHILHRLSSCWFFHNIIYFYPKCLVNGFHHLAG